MTTITYSYSKYFDVLDTHLKLLKKSLPAWRHIVFADLPFNGAETLVYNESLPYSSEYIRLLEEINDEYFLYLQDDFWLYGQPNDSKLELYKQYLIENPQYSFVKLLKSGEGEGRHVVGSLFECSKQQPFSMQATIWRKNDLLKLYSYKTVQKMREENSFFDGSQALGINGLYHFDNEPRRGEWHHDSNVFPYIATAIVKGEWNFKEYSKELNELGGLLDIDYSRRPHFV